MSKHIEECFESGFLSQSLAKQIASCDKYELAPLFLRLFREKQPVLEAVDGVDGFINTLYNLMELTGPKNCVTERHAKCRIQNS